MHDDKTEYIYSITDKRDFSLYMYMSIYEQKINLSLSHKSCGMDLLELRLERVQAIRTTKEKMIIIQENNNEALNVFFTPNFALYWSELDI